MKKEGLISKAKSFFSGATGSLYSLVPFGKSKDVVNPYSAYTWVYVCIKIIASSGAGIPLVVKRKSDGATVEDENNPWVKLFKRPNILMSGTQFWRSVIIYHQNYGEVFIIPRADSSMMQLALPGAVPEALEVVDTKYIEPDVQNNVLIGWKYKKQNGVSESFGLNQVIRIFELNPDSILKALAPWQPGATTINSDVKANEYNNSFFENGGQIQGVLTAEGPDNQDLTKEEVDKIRADWESKFSGPNGQHRTPVLYGGLKYTMTGATQKDMDFKDMRILNREEVLALYRVPKTKAGLTDSVDRAVAKVFDKQFYQDNVMPMLRDYEDAFNTTLFEGSDFYIEFDASGVEALSEDFEIKADNAKKLQELGYGLNEINEKLDLGMEEISDSWAELAIDTRQIPQDPSAQNSSGSGEEGKSAPVMIREKVYLKNYDDLSDEDLNKLYIDEVLEGRNMTRFEKALIKYFNRLEKEQLKNLEEFEDKAAPDTKANADDVLFDLEEWNAILINETSRYLETAFEESSDFLEKEIGGFTGFVFDEDPDIKAQLERKKIRITQINLTVEKSIRSALVDGVANNETVEEITERVRKTFDVSRSRSLTIARTEISQSAGAARQVAMQREGLKKKWVDAGDKEVRETHREYALKGVQNMSYDYTNGQNLKFPGDMDCEDPAEIINCRCITRAVRS